MALTHGMRLGAYEILALVGAGGMAEVYRARDTRLDRTVAIKVLHASFASSPQRRERFEREARAISSLNHPHICALYDVGDAPNPDPSSLGDDTVRFLVLEYLEGQTLAERLTRGPLPPAEALRHAIAIGDALDKAHRCRHRPSRSEAGERHADADGGEAARLRPREERRAGRGGRREHRIDASVERSPRRGRSSARCQYMAPEQIEGLEADARTDIFAFGALLFEMLTGRPAFEGKTRASLIGAILKDEPPPVSRVQPVVPAALDRIISTCLAKDPDDRYQSARDLVRDLTWVASGSSDGAGARTVTSASRDRVVSPWLVAAVLAVGLIATAVIGLRRAGELDASGRSGAVHHRAAGERVVWRSEPWWQRHRHAAGGVS